MLTSVGFRGSEVPEVVRAHCQLEAVRGACLRPVCGGRAQGQPGVQHERVRLELLGQRRHGLRRRAHRGQVREVAYLVP